MGLLLLAIMGCSIMAVAQPQLLPAVTENVTLSLSESQYRQGIRMENTKLYLNAIGTYSSLLTNFDMAVSGNTVPLDRDELAVAIGSAYRLGLLTPRYLSSTGESLVDQLEIYQRTHRQIETLVATMVRHEGEFSPKEYRIAMAYLVMARGVNMVGWSERLYLAAAWKNYVVVPMPDLVGLFTTGMADIQASLVLDRVNLYDPILDKKGSTYPKMSRKFYLWRQPLYQAYYKARLRQYSADTLVYKVAVLVTGDNRPTQAAAQLADHRLKHGLAAVYYFNSAKTKKILREGTELSTVNQIINDRDFERAIAELSRLVGIRS